MIRYFAFYLGRGNVAAGAGNLQPYLNYFGPALSAVTTPGTGTDNKRYYKLSLGEADWFCLSTDVNEPDGRTASSVQAQWLQRELRASTASYRVVYFHHAPFSSGPHHTDTNIAEVNWPFEEWGATTVINGHDHTAVRRLVHTHTCMLEWDRLTLLSFVIRCASPYICRR